MSEDVKLEVIRTTQNSLSKHIKKPPLTEKLLRKPPFRYLHDITTSVMRETGYLQGLYSQDELNPENIKDRESKIAFLEKLIAAVNLSTGVNITARPNKIVAGLDVTKTNELLQAIAKALEKKVDSSKAVEQILNKNIKGSNQQNTTLKESSKSKAGKEAKPVETKKSESRNSDSLKRKTKDKPKNAEKQETRKSRTKKDESPTKITKAKIIEESPIEPVKDDKIPKQEKVSSEPQAKADLGLPIDLNVTNDGQDTEAKLDIVSAPVPVEDERRQDSVVQEEVDALELPPDKPLEENSRKEIINPKQESRGENIQKPEEELKRPQSARAIHRKKPIRKPSSDVTTRSPSKIGESKAEPESILEPNEITEKKLVQPNHTSSEPSVTKRPRTAARPASARPGAPRVRDRGTILLNDTDTKVVNEPVNLIVDSKDLPKDDDETLVTVEAPVADVTTDQVANESTLLTGDQGHLVSQILETQKELEDTALSNVTKEPSHRVDITWRSGRQEAVIREVDKLQSAIQALTRAANPLGKLIDFLQEDVESMQGELESWVVTNRQLATQLQAEERLTEESIEPLARQLEDIEQLIEEQLEETSVVKAAVIRNDERFTRLLRSNTRNLPG